MTHTNPDKNTFYYKARVQKYYGNIADICIIIIVIKGWASQHTLELRI